MHSLQRRTHGATERWPGRGPARAERATVLALAALIAVVSVSSGQALASARHPRATPARARLVSPPRAGKSPGKSSGSTQFDWPMLHQNPARQGYTQNTTLSTANAGSLGVAWATNMFGPALDSPVVAYNTSRSQTLAYIGTERGVMLAVDMATGKIVWSVWLGAPIRSTPVVDGGSIWVGAWDPARIFKLDASTGAVQCSVAAPQQIEGSPLAVTPRGGVDTVYFGTEDNVTTTGPLVAIKASDCSVEWSFNHYGVQSGSWTPLSYAVDAQNRPLIVFGTSDPDSQVYAVNAVTGQKVWSFRLANPAPYDYDVGTGVTISPPGNNGFADGVGYVVSKSGILYALDLTTGKQIWSYAYASALHLPNSDISTPALDGTNLVFGDSVGMVDVNAITGAPSGPIWSDQDPLHLKVVSSPAIAGSPGSEIVATADLAGEVDVASLATGAVLYHYQTGGYITGSPAITDGNILVASSDGFLYDFAVGGGNETSLPSTTISSPKDLQVIANPGGKLTVTGSAGDTAGVKAVEVAIQAGGANGPWWDATTGTWVPGPVANDASLTSAGKPSSGWTFGYPVPSSGGTYQIFANARAVGGQSDIKGSAVHMTVRTATSGPLLVATAGFVAPGSAATIIGHGFGPGEKVAIGIPGGTLATITASSKGGIPSTSVAFPVTAPFGPTALTATGQTTHRQATAAIVITNNWDQLGDGPGHLGVEANDTVLYNTITPGDSIFIDPAWAYQTNAAVTAAPAVANEVAYTGNAAGQLRAVDIHNGSLLWTWSDPSLLAISGSPAIDPAANLVFVGAADGTLDAVANATGKLVWSNAVGGQVYAPVYAAGQLYVTSSNGTVEAVSEAKGQRSWSTVLAGPGTIVAAPTLDPASNTLFVSKSNGDIVALNSVSGARRWTYSSGGAVSAPVMVDGGTVYFGAGDSVYGISETTGTKLWSYATSGAVQDTPVLTNIATGGTKLVMVGSDDGILYALDGVKGSLLWKTPFGQPIVGVVTADSVVIVDTKSGLVGLGRTYTNLKLWTFHTPGSAGITAPPALVDGTVYVGAGDGNLYAFTPYGRPPY